MAKDLQNADTPPISPSFLDAGWFKELTALFDQIELKTALLVQFGEYLLSPEREATIHSGYDKERVYDTDISNFFGKYDD